MQVVSSYHSASAAVSVAQARPQPTGAGGASTEPASVYPAQTAPAADSGDGRARAQATSLNYRRTDKTALFIETQEGDVVRLKFKSRQSAQLDTAHAEGAGASSTDVSLRTRSASKLSIKVSGDLNAEELEAITEAIEQATELAESFFYGDVEAAFAGAAALDIDGEQLAQVNLRMRSRERLTYSGVAYGPPPVAAPPAEPRLPDPSTPAPDPAQEIPGPRAQPIAPQPVGEPAAAPPVVETVGAGEPPATEPDQVDPGERVSKPSALTRPIAFRILGEYLSQLMDGLASSDDSGPGAGLDVSLKLRIFESTLVTMSGARSDDSDAMPQLVHDTVDALAAQEEAALNQVA